MKKSLLLTSAAALLSMASQAQLALETFNSGIPSTWTRYNVDGLTPDPSVAYVNNAWVTMSVAASDSAIVSTSWYSPVGTANDWITSPSFTVNSTIMYLIWQEWAIDAQFPDGYEVRVSTTGNTVADFSTVLYSTASASTSGLTYKTANLGAYNGQTIRVAFRNNSTDKFLLAIDNVEAKMLPALDASVMTANVDAIVSSSGTIGFDFRNEGTSAITSIDASYSIDGGTPVTQTFSGLNIPSYGMSSHQFTTAVGTLTAGSHNVVVTINQVNGVADGNAANNSGNGTFVYASGTAPRNCLIEEFTSSTCVPCASFNSTFDPFILAQNANKANSNFNVVKYQMNWPNPGNDVSYNADGAGRRGYYGVNSIPWHFTNGIEGGNGDAAELADCKAEVSYMDMSATYNVTSNPDSIQVSVTVTPHFTMSNANMKLYIALLEDHYVNNGATTSQKDYYHVMRKMLPDFNGTTLTNFTSGTPQTFTFKYKYTVGPVTQNSYNFWGSPNNGSVVAFVQNSNSDEILQSVSARTAISSVGSLKDNFESLIVYPNPATQNAYLEFNVIKPTNTMIQVTDVMGRVVENVANETLNAGMRKFAINTEKLPAGVYNIKIQTENGSHTERLTVVK